MTYKDLGFQSPQQWFIYYLRISQYPEDIATMQPDYFANRFGLSIEEVNDLRTTILNPRLHGNPPTEASLSDLS
jgi:hypothetical protein